MRKFKNLVDNFWHPRTIPKPYSELYSQHSVIVRISLFYPDAIALIVRYMKGDCLGKSGIF